MPTRRADLTSRRREPVPGGAATWESRVSTPSGARQSLAPEAATCASVQQAEATCRRRSVRRTSDPNERDRPLGGAGEPARCRASIGRGPGRLSQAQAMITSHTARRAVARERRDAATGAAACQALPRAPKGIGGKGLVVGGGSEIGPSKKGATAGGERGGGSTQSLPAG